MAIWTCTIKNFIFGVDEETFEFTIYNYVKGKCVFTEDLNQTDIALLAQLFNELEIKIKEKV